jgi:hypothetical protein
MPPARLIRALDAFVMSGTLEQESSLNKIKGLLRRVTWRKAALLAVAVILLLPFPTTFVPEWKVRVIDADGRPASGARVTLMWNEYTLGLEGSSEQWTDADGHTVVPRQAGWASLLRRAAFPVLASIFGPLNVHASRGFHARAWAVTKDNRSEMVELDLQKGAPTELILLP